MICCFGSKCLRDLDILGNRAGSMRTEEFSPSFGKARGRKVGYYSFVLLLLPVKVPNR